MLLFIMKLALSILEEKYAIQTLWRLRGKDEIFLQELGGVDTNAYQWEYAVGGITYLASTYTFFSDSITYDSVTVNTGGSATFQIVFEVPSGLGDGVVRYDGYSSTTVIRDPALL